MTKDRPLTPVRRSEGPVFDQTIVEHMTTPATDGSVRLSVNINTQIAELINNHMEAENVSATEAVRRLISWGNLVYQADVAGQEVIVKDGRSASRILLYREGSE